MPETGRPNYEHGQCHILALALHEASGLPLRVALAVDEGRTCLVHAWVRLPDGLGLHSRGRESVADMLSYFPDGDEAWVEQITKSALLRLGEGSSRMTADVKRRIAEAGRTVALLLDSEAEVARRVAAIHESACSEEDEASQNAALANEIEELFRELTPGLEAMVAKLRLEATEGCPRRSADRSQMNYERP